MKIWLKFFRKGLLQAIAAKLESAEKKLLLQKDAQELCG